MTDLYWLKTNGVLASLIITALSFILPHEFHVSRCEITYRTETQSLEIIQHIYVDDLELALKRDFEGPIHLCTELEIDQAEELVKQYISKHFSVTTSDGPVKLQFLGKEEGEELMAMWIYIEATGVSLTSELTITYDVLCDQFNDQKNILSFQIDNNKKEMFLLDKSAREVTIATNRNNEWSPGRMHDHLEQCMIETRLIASPLEMEWNKL